MVLDSRPPVPGYKEEVSVALEEASDELEIHKTKV